MPLGRVLATGDVDPDEPAPVEQEAARIGAQGLWLAGGGAVGAHDLVDLVEVAGLGGQGAGHVDGGEPATPVAQETVVGGVGVDVVPGDPTEVVDGGRPRLHHRARGVEAGEAALVQHERGKRGAWTGGGAGAAGLGRPWSRGLHHRHRRRRRGRECRKNHSTGDGQTVAAPAGVGRAAAFMLVSFLGASVVSWHSQRHVPRITGGPPLRLEVRPVSPAEARGLNQSRRRQPARANVRCAVSADAWQIGLG
jgi:hypothetical protein